MSSAAPYIGSKISLVTNSDLRYEGVLININTAQSTVTLRDVRMTGTERQGQFVVPTHEVYDYIVFNGKDIKDLTVSEPAPPATICIRQDPAVVAVNIPPPHVAFNGGGCSHSYDHHHHHHQSQNSGMYGNMGRGYGGNKPPGRNGGPGANRMSGRYDTSYGGPNRQQKMNSRVVVGELSAQPNSSLKQQVADAFDFEQANTQFNKDTGALEDSEATTIPAGGSSEHAYNKEKSFFDNISCEALSRKQGVPINRVDREKQRELDSETFGAAAMSSGPRYPRRSFKRNVRNTIRRPPGPVYPMPQATSHVTY